MERTFFLCLLSITFVCTNLSAQQRVTQTPANLETHRLENAHWKVNYHAGGIVGIESAKDIYQANLLNGELGDVLLHYKVKDGIWIKINTLYERTLQNITTVNGFLPSREMKVDDGAGSILYRDRGVGNAIEMNQQFRLDGELLHWTIEVVNNSKFPIEIGDLAIAFPWRSGGGEDPIPIFEKSFTKHAFISADASFLYFSRYNGEAPYFLMTVDPGTKLEYFDINPSDRKYRTYIYSGKTGTAETRGTWRQEHTRTWLQPVGTDQNRISFGFTIHAADSYQQMKDQIVASRSIDIDVLPGMTLPINQKAKFSLKTLCSIDAIEAEFPAQTTVKYIGKKGDNTHIYEVEFRKLGENMLTVKFDGGRKTYLEFFSCESPETVTKKRSSFLVNTQQFRDPTKWYNGLYGVYDMKNGELRGPDNPDIYDEVLTYFLASDDPILGKAPFIASKNVVFPNDAEIASLEYHLKNFVWGGLQRTDKETPFPYAIYGTPHWYMHRTEVLRNSIPVSYNEIMRAWRTFDYAHMVMLYWHMYQIAKLYPEKCTFMNADQYLEIAHGTAKGYFLYSDQLVGDNYEAIKWACYNELVIPDLIDELEIKGFKEKAAELRFEWEKKTKYFIYDDKYPFRSEYSSDRTAFESSYFLAKYGVMNNMKADQNLWYDNIVKKWYSHPVVTKADARDFMERQHLAGVSCRGYLEKQYFILGGAFNRSSDGSVQCYMARMGGTSILDYGYHFADDPYEWLRLGYASYLAPYCVVNTGTSESNYGFWYPGKEKDGAMGQAFTSVKFGTPWIRTEEARGPWRYCGEGDLGMCAITRTAVTMLVDDPIFGWSIFGGNMTEEQNQFAVYPDDGTRTRFRVVNDKLRIGVELDRDNWSATQPIIVNKDLKSMDLVLENPLNNKHTTRIKVDAKGVSNPRLSADGKNIPSKRDRYGNWIFDVPVEKAKHAVKMTWR